MQKEQIAGLVRHVLTGVGGYAVARGYADESVVIEAVGILSSITGFIWSIFTKDKQIDNGYDPRRK